MLVEVRVCELRLDSDNKIGLVVLKEVDGDRLLRIYIGEAEALAIAYHLESVPVARPLTHDLLRDVLERMGAHVESVVVNDLENDTFYARIIVTLNGERMDIDSRPSDAIALAVRAQVPIFAEDAVMEKAGVLLDQDGKSGEERLLNQEPIKKVDEEELQRMSAFRDFIESLDLDDFEKRKS